MKFVVLNGPPYSGKTTIAKELTKVLFSRGHNVSQDSFAAPMKHFVSVALGEKYLDMPKDAPKDLFRGRSVRQFLIHLSEEYMKEQYGEDIFGRLLYHRALRHPENLDYMIVDDSGFGAELSALRGAHFLIKVIRPERDFVGDSRGYLHKPNFIFENTGEMSDLMDQVRVLADKLEGK